MRSVSPYPWQQPLWQSAIERVRANRLPHAILLAGPAGMGKRHFAKALAQALLCSNPSSQGEACGTCRDCLLFQADSHPDWLALEPEEGKKGIGIAQIRSLIAFQSLTSQYGKRRVVVITPADTIQQAAANALLKTLEEPAGDTVLLLVSDQPASLLATVRSRCQQWVFRPLSDLDSDSQQWLCKELEAQGDDSQVWRALFQASGGAPLRTLALAREGGLALRATVLEGLASLNQGQGSAVALAREWESQGLERLLPILYALVADMIRLKLLPQSEQGLSHPSLRGNLQALAEQVDLAFIDALLQHIQRRMGLLQGQVKGQVILEDILLAWQQRRV